MSLHVGWMDVFLVQHRYGWVCHKQDNCLENQFYNMNFICCVGHGYLSSPFADLFTLSSEKLSFISFHLFCP